MTVLFALLLSLQAFALPQEVYVSFDKEEAKIELSPSSQDPSGIDLSFNVNFVNQNQEPVTLSSLEILMNGLPTSEFALKNSGITLHRLDSHTIRLKDLRFSRSDNPKDFTFILHATGRQGQKFTHATKIAIN